MTNHATFSRNRATFSPRTCTGKTLKWVIQLFSIKSFLFLLLENRWLLAAGVSSNNFHTFLSKQALTVLLRSVKIRLPALDTVQQILAKDQVTDESD